MTTTFEHIPDAFSIPNVLSPQQCKQLILETEQIGYDNATHPKYQKKFIDDKELKNRQNMRCVHELDATYLGAIWQKIAPFVPQERLYAVQNQPDQKEKWELPFGNAEAYKNLNELVRFYRYDANKQFGAHFDNAFHRNGSEMSHYSLLLYLNDDFVHGETKFYKFDAQMETKVTLVQPCTGMVMIFAHVGANSPLHEGCPHTTSNAYKYVMRSDIMYKYVGIV